MTDKALPSAVKMYAEDFGPKRTSRLERYVRRHRDAEHSRQLRFPPATPAADVSAGIAAMRVPLHLDGLIAAGVQLQNPPVRFQF